MICIVLSILCIVIFILVEHECSLKQFFYRFFQFINTMKYVIYIDSYLTYPLKKSLTHKDTLPSNVILKNYSIVRVYNASFFYLKCSEIFSHMPSFFKLGVPIDLFFF